MLGLAEEELRRRLAAFSLEAFYAQRGTRLLEKDKLAAGVLGRNPRQLEPPAEIVWFHLTRVPADVTFDEGLLPLRDCLGSVYQRLRCLAAELGIHRAQGEPNSSYRSKLSRLDREGPCGCLLRDAAFSRNGDRKFLQSPEIVEDIAQELAGLRGAPELLALYRSQSRPCVVSFVSRDPQMDAIESATMYLHAVEHALPHPAGWGTYHNGKGTKVPPADIIHVEWLPEPTSA